MGLEAGIIDLGRRMEDRNDSNKGYRNSKRMVNCESCGSHGDDMKSIFIFQTVNRNGKMFRVGGNIREVRLCRTCRIEMSRLLSEQ